MTSDQTPNPEFQVETVPEDAFASGQENVLNRAFFHLVKWIFAGPHFPAESIWFLIALALTQIALVLMRQHPEYWTDPSTSTAISFLGAPYAWGPWTVLALHLAYLLIVSLLLRCINLKLALPAWVALCLLHLLPIPGSFACWTAPTFSFFNMNYCSQSYAAVLLALGILWAVALACLVCQGVIPLNTGLLELEPMSRFDLPARLKRGSIAWICLLSIGIGVAAFPAKPEWKPLEGGQTVLNAPSGRTLAALAYDTKREKAILFGGTSVWTQATDWIGLGDTWEWDGTSWHQLTPATSPSPRRNATLVYDPNRDRMVMFGGVGQDVSNQSVFWDDTWEWDGQNWVESKPATHPAARGGASLYYDSSSQKVVLYAGYFKDSTGQSAFFDDTWEWDGKTWTQITLKQSRRDSGAASLYYEKEQLPLLVDGEGLWVLQDSSWHQPNYPQTPPGRWSSSLAFDQQLQQAILFGGNQGEEIFNDTWAFNGVTWKKLVTAKQPPARYGHNLFFDMKRKRILLFGGYDGKTVYNDMWELVQP